VSPADTTVTSERTHKAAGPNARARLHVVHPPELRRAWTLTDGETTLGRDPGLDGVLLDHGTISRRHATLAGDRGRGTHVARDLGSRNGTWLDGVAVAGEPRTLVDGSVLRLGDTLLVYERRDEPQVDDDADVSRDALPGEAAAVRHLRALLPRAARDPAPVLIVGETGTGKERLAREVHRLSGRAGKLVPLNCAALTAPLVDSQLFGHVKGAFTGAGEAQPGLFRAAHGGTLFLDEIGDLPLELQPKLLRALQEGEVLPVGATQPVRVDVRVVAATHRELLRAIGAGTFREDLYARLSIWELRVPPLRERRVDLLPWVDRLHAAWAAPRGAHAALSFAFDADAAEAVLRFAWPLNLRGLDRLVHDLASTARGPRAITRADLPAWLTADAAPSEDVRAAAPAAPAAREAVPTREEFTRAFEEVDGSVHALAKRFGRDRRQIYRWLEAHGLAEARDKRKT
jgi:transcriptional regulator with PAS, ATPase and Fis domain